MQAVELPLFSIDTPQQNVLNPVKKITEDQSIPPQDNLEVVLNSLIPSTQDQNRIQKARNVLGEIAKDLTDEQIDTHVTQFEYLVSCWLDLYEKNLLRGKTLKELLKLI